jgi:hypothetical protein
MVPQKRPFLLFFALAASVSSAMALPPVLQKTYTWIFDGLPQTLEVDLSTNAYLHYRTRPRTWSYSAYLSESAEYPIMANFASALEDAALLRTDSEWERVRYAVCFVQHFKYSDDTGGEYPRYPLETLVDGTGDCEDTAILLAAILDAWGLDCVLISPPGHMAVGITVSGFEGTFYPYLGKRYYYIETTGKNWGIGEIPPQYAGQAKLIPLQTISGPRRTVGFEPPKEPLETKLQFAVYRSSTHGGSGEGRVSYSYKIMLEGSPKMLERVQEVRYQRQHTTFPEYREGTWLSKTNPETNFSANWSAWRNANIAVQVEFKNGNVTEFMIKEAAFEEAR